MNAARGADEKVVREQLLALLRGGNAHMGFDEAVAGFPLDQINAKPPRLPYSFWHLLEHMRIVQWDILEFVRNPDHVSPPYPEGYWPDEEEKAGKDQWERTLRDYRADLKGLQDILTDPSTDLFGPIPHAKGYNAFREMVLAADHNAYHIGEFVILRRTMGFPAEGPF